MRAVNHIIVKKLKLCDKTNNDERLEHVTNEGEKVNVFYF